MPGVGLMVKLVGLGSKDPEFKSPSAVELIPGGVDSACHPSEVGKMSTSMLGILCRSGDPSRIVSNSQGDCFGSTNTLHRVWSQSKDGGVLNSVWISRHTSHKKVNCDDNSHLQIDLLRFLWLHAQTLVKWMWSVAKKKTRHFCLKCINLNNKHRHCTNPRRCGLILRSLL